MSDLIKELLERGSNLTLHNANEAETRKKLIDRIIEDVLGWKDLDIAYEERVSEDGKTTFADYIIRTADTSILIEAKRIGVTFSTIPERKKIKLSGSIMEGKTGEASSRPEIIAGKNLFLLPLLQMAVNGYYFLQYVQIK